MSNSEHDTRSDPAFEQNVRNLAHTLWEQDGRPEGRAQEHWYAALKHLHHRQLGDPKPGQSDDDAAPQLDDNIDDLGRPASNPRGRSLDQPV